MSDFPLQEFLASHLAKRHRDEASTRVTYDRATSGSPRTARHSRRHQIADVARASRSLRVACARLLYALADRVAPAPGMGHQPVARGSHLNAR